MRCNELILNIRSTHFKSAYHKGGVTSCLAHEVMFLSAKRRALAAYCVLDFGRTVYYFVYGVVSQYLRAADLLLSCSSRYYHMRDHGLFERIP